MSFSCMSFLVKASPVQSLVAPGVSFGAMMWDAVQKEGASTQKSAREDDTSSETIVKPHVEITRPHCY